jgi:hypothetical protein
MHKKLLVAALVLAVVLSAGAALADEPSATVSMEITSAAIGLGATGGQGVLTYQGKTYTFKVKGFDKLALGMQKVSVNGDVYNLTKLSDLEGKYKKAEPAGITFIKGKKDLVIQNGKGVTINVKGKEKGLSLNVVKEGLTIFKIKP